MPLEDSKHIWSISPSSPPRQSILRHATLSVPPSAPSRERKASVKATIERIPEGNCSSASTQITRDTVKKVNEYHDSKMRRDSYLGQGVVLSRLHSQSLIRTARACHLESNSTFHLINRGTESSKLSKLQGVTTSERTFPFIL